MEGVPLAGAYRLQCKLAGQTRIVGKHGGSLFSVSSHWRTSAVYNIAPLGFRWCLHVCHFCRLLILGCDMVGLKLSRTRALGCPKAWRGKINRWRGCLSSQPPPAPATSTPAPFNMEPTPGTKVPLRSFSGARKALCQLLPRLFIAVSLHPS